MDLKPEDYDFSAELAKKQTLVIDCSFFYSVMFMVIFSRFGLLEGLWGQCLFHGGPPRAPMNSFTSIVTINPCQVQPPVQSGKFIYFWGMLNCYQLTLLDRKSPLPPLPLLHIRTSKLIRNVPR